MPTLEEIEELRATRKAAVEKQREAQLVIDLTEVNKLEEEHGDGNVVIVNLAKFTPGLPSLLALKPPSPPQLKRYQDMCSGKGQKKGDPLAAAHLVADTCLLYPDKDIYEKILEESPGIKAIAGVAAVTRSAGSAEEEGKD